MKKETTCDSLKSNVINNKTYKMFWALMSIPTCETNSWTMSLFPL